MARTFTSALLVMKGGQVVVERYRNLSDPQSRFLSMSASKSITSILIGIAIDRGAIRSRSEEHTSELQSLMRTSYAVFCLKKKKRSTPYERNRENYITEST